ncbi:peptide-methionine (S)-S-oxide reductase MsrA [Geomicrobium sediminis]|uniref:Peptide methionine sulfoxide reductase MsrA n=1 Tax=Geomicrobium sediminis TaxID=1347788 RepID=A0ABS2PHV3_9BACL|nr:peptide-methionine (S)-S-oxide reductase MsrA [Geomicrobium sediminis]MBM7634916.1 peptide-methionine (S)-S-oxide reductase [Geomicrobium sediminis]
MATERAIFAGGCFWCMVQPFEEQAGIQAVTSGYIGGEISDPTYEQVKRGTSGHYEAVEILFDPTLYKYTQLLDLFWPQIDPTDPDGQFHDRGSQYRTAIFYVNDEQKELATKSKIELESSGRFKQPIVTEIKPATTFYPAEAEHQQFYKTNPAYYKTDRKASGRDEFIRHHWE